MKFYLTILLCLLILCCTRAQGLHAVKGTVSDTGLKRKISLATICILNEKDSVLQSFTYSKYDGSFSIGHLPTGRFIIMVNFHDYAGYIEHFSIEEGNSEHDFGTIPISLKSKVLQEVIIHGGSTAIRMKGDTTEYNAKSYVIQPNDKVEDLLRQLPGIQVDKDGKITAQGQAVNKVLVDGEEFFTDDPTLVTKNIRADMVSSVQLFDKKSDQAVFTGIDDGKKNKTLNIKLKEDKKKGVFGKVDVGAGSNGYYQAQALYNVFKQNEKFSAYGTNSNTGKLGLGFADNNRLGSGNVQIGDDGLIPLPTNGDLDATTGVYDGKGSPLARSGGLHYDNKWNDGRQTVGTNYKIGYLEVNGLNTVETQQSIPGGQINTNASQQFRNSVFRQKADATFQIKLDTTATIKISVDGSRKNVHNINDYLTTNKTGINEILNYETRSNTADGNQSILNSNLFFTKKFRKPRRTFSWNIIQYDNKEQSSGYLISTINFFDNLGKPSGTQNTNQFRVSDNTAAITSSNMTYTEPLLRKVSLILNYGIGFNTSHFERKVYNRSGNSYDLIDTLYSNNYNFRQLSNQFGAALNYQTNRTTLNFGAKLSATSYTQTNIYNGLLYKHNFTNLMPQVSYQYNFSKNMWISTQYNGSSNQPTIEQLQPLTNNDNPLVLVVGNPGLKPSFTNNFTATFRGSRPISSFYFYFSPSYSFTTNAIINNITTDLSGRSTIGYINLSDKKAYNYDLFLNAGRTIKSLGLGVSVTLSGNGSIDYSNINGVLNMSTRYNYSASVNLSKSKQKKYSLSATLSPNYSVTKFSLTKFDNNNAGGFTSTGRAVLYLPGKIQISSDLSRVYKARTATFSEQNVTILNSAVSRTFLKGDNLKLSVSGSDLLNQNLNVSRSLSGNTATQSSYSTIRRYFMLSVTWDFTKFGTVKTQD